MTDFEYKLQVNRDWGELYYWMVHLYPLLPFQFGEEVIPLNPKEISLIKLDRYIMDNYASAGEFYDNAISAIRASWQFFFVFPDAELAVDRNASLLNRLSCINREEAINSYTGHYSKQELDKAFTGEWTAAMVLNVSLRQQS